MEETSSKDKKICECGFCSELIPAFGQRGPRKFKHNHHMRGKKRTEIAIKNISEAKKGDKNPMWNGGKSIHDGYVFLLMPKHPNCDSKGYYSEHRWVMEQYLGRYLTEEEEVHHKNGIRDDNRIENLELTNRSAHIRQHRLEDIRNGKILFGGKTRWGGIRTQ